MQDKQLNISYNSQDFAETINSLDRGMPNALTNCELFGITFGCSEDCPTFQLGKCEHSYFEQLNMFKQNDMLCEPIEDIVNKYSDLLTKEECETLLLTTRPYADHIHTKQ